MNRYQMISYITETYNALPEYPWVSAPGYAVFRHANNKKWFAVIMDISKRKIGLNDDSIIDVMNIKCDPILIGSLQRENGFFPAYHMSKTHWITVALDGSADEEKIKWLLDLSYDLTSPKIKNKYK